MRLLTLTLILLFPAIVSAQEFQPLVGIPGVSAASPDIGQYVNALYILAITVGGLLAVAKIVLGGVQYMFSDVVTDKSEAKRSIFGAIIGLLIILSTFVVLGEVNSNLTNLSVLDAGRVLQLQSAGQAPITRRQVSDDVTRKACGDSTGISCEALAEECRKDRAFERVEIGENTVTCMRDRNKMLGEDRRESEIDESIIALQKRPGSPLFGKEILEQYNNRSDFADTAEKIAAYKTECEATAGNTFIQQPVISSGTAYLCTKEATITPPEPNR